MYSSSSSFWYIFQLLCIICYITTITSYRVNSRPSIVDRNDRAVTEWRFRRNHGLNHPYLFENYIRSNGLENSDIDDYKQMDEMKLKEKKFIIPELIYPRSE